MSCVFLTQMYLGKLMAHLQLSQCVVYGRDVVLSCMLNVMTSQYVMYGRNMVLSCMLNVLTPLVDICVDIISVSFPRRS